MVKVYLLLVACLSLSITAVTGPIVALTAISNLEQNAIKTVAPRRIPVARNIDFAPKALRSLEHSISGPIVELEEAASVKYKPLGRSIRSREIAYSPEAKLSLSRRPNDIVVPHNEYSQTQGQIGSCHIFTMAQVLANMIFRETGKYLDPASYFSDHLAKQASTRPKNPVESFSNSHIKDVANIKIHGPDCSMYEEGSYFYDDLKLIQMVGSELLGSSSGKEYSTLVRAIGDLKAAKTALLNSKVELDLAAKQAKLERPAKAILSRSVFVIDELRSGDR